MLPVGHRGQESANLELLEVHEIVDEPITERRAEAGVIAQRRDGIHQRLRQGRCIGAVRRVGGGSGIGARRDPIEARGDLRGHVKIRICRRLADAVLQAGRRIIGLADNAHHRCAIVVSPHDMIGRHRVRHVALVAVDRRRAERRRCGRTPQQTAQPTSRQLRQPVRVRKQIAASCRVLDRMVQMPARRSRVRQAVCGNCGRHMKLAR